MKEITFREEIHEYELVDYSGTTLARRYRLFRLTEEEAHSKNESYVLNRVSKRFVRTESRFPKNSKKT